MSLNINSTNQINGQNGYYDDKEKDASIRYGRNAVTNNIKQTLKPFETFSTNTAPILDYSLTPEATDNNINALENFANQNDEYMNSLPPLEFEYRYMPEHANGQIDKKAVLGAAYEEMGAKELTVEEFEESFLPNDNFTAEPLDLNKDGKIDIAEYGTNIIATDILSKDTTDVTKADGVINSNGLNKIMEYTQKINADNAVSLYKNVNNYYNLSDALDDFNPEV